MDNFRIPGRRTQAHLTSLLASETGSIFNIDVELDLVNADGLDPKDCHQNVWSASALSGLFVIQQQDLAGCQACMESTSQGECVNAGPQAVGPG